MTSNGWNPKKITAGMKLKKTARPPGAAVHQDQVRGVQRNSVACVCVCVWNTGDFIWLHWLHPISEKKYHENGRKNASEDVFSYWDIWWFPACHVSWLEGITNPLLAFLSFARCCWPWSICRPMGRFFFVSTRRRPWVMSVRRSWKCWTYHAVRLDHPEVGVRDPLKWWKPL